MSALKVHNLYRYFGNLQAVNGVSFEVPHGSVCGFVGANGAGKTTTMRILATLDYPTMGTAEVCGINVVNHPSEVRKLIGWMPDHFGNYEHMT
ncbi:MAG TPA: ATP-binding cassette domain-containing protein, partial [Luteolibacter sp.]